MGTKDYKTQGIWLFHRVYGIIYDSINSTYAKLMRERKCFCLFNLKVDMWSLNS